MQTSTIVAIVIALLIIIISAVGIYFYWRKKQTEDEDVPIDDAQYDETIPTADYEYEYDETIPGDEIDPLPIPETEPVGDEVDVGARGGGAATGKVPAGTVTTGGRTDQQTLSDLEDNAERENEIEVGATTGAPVTGRVPAGTVTVTGGRTDQQTLSDLEDNVEQENKNKNKKKDKDKEDNSSGSWWGAITGAVATQSTPTTTVTTSKKKHKNACPRGTIRDGDLCWPTNICSHDPMFTETLKECKPLAYSMSRKYSLKKKCEQSEGRPCGYYSGFYLAPECLGEVKRGYKCYPQCLPGTRKKGNTCIKNSSPVRT